MNYNKLNEKIIKSWRIARTIGIVVLTIILIGFGTLGYCTKIFDTIFTPIGIGGAVLLIYSVLGLVVFPAIEYRQWGYTVEDDKVVIKHGLFWIKKTIIPVIRIQNITVAQGPINRQLGLFNVKIALASGEFDIIGLDKETADSICENLKAKLYKRMKVKGEMTNEIWT